MNDTSPEIQKMLDERYQKMTGMERIKIASSMFETARTFVLASLDPNLSKQEKLVQVFLRFYDQDFSEEAKEKIIKQIRSRD